MAAGKPRFGRSLALGARKDRLEAYPTLLRVVVALSKTTILVFVTNPSYCRVRPNVDYLARKR
jgi:hypothetical protein